MQRRHRSARIMGGNGVGEEGMYWENRARLQASTREQRGIAPIKGKGACARRMMLDCKGRESRKELKVEAQW